MLIHLEVLVLIKLVLKVYMEMCALDGVMKGW